MPRRRKSPGDIRSLARAHTESAVNTLAGIMNEPSSPPDSRVRAAQVLLERGWGKPPQHATHDINLVTHEDALKTLESAASGPLLEHEQSGEGDPEQGQ